MNRVSIQSPGAREGGAQPRALLPPWDGATLLPPWDGPAGPPCFAAGRVSEWAALAHRLASL